MQVTEQELVDGMSIVWLDRTKPCRCLGELKRQHSSAKLRGERAPIGSSNLKYIFRCSWYDMCCDLQLDTAKVIPDDEQNKLEQKLKDLEQ